MTTAARELFSPAHAFVPTHRRLPRRTVIAGLMATTALAFAGTRQIHAQESTPEGTDAAGLLPRDVILSLEAVQDALPEIASETATGPNSTVVGTPVANRAVTYSTADGAHHVVLSVDQYATSDKAKRSFDEAFEASKKVPGVTTESVSDLGEAALIGVVTQGDETHVGGGALFGNLIVNATLQAFDGTDENKKLVAELIRLQADHAEKALGAAVSATPAA